MKIPEIQYQPGQVSSNVAPVEQVDVTAGLSANQQRTAQEMQANLVQLQRNGGTRIQNVRDQAFPIEKLTQLSETAANLMVEKAEQMKSDLEAEMTMLAYQDGFNPTKEFEQSEKEFQKTGQQMDQRANNYQRDTGDYEGAERIRELSGWKKYYYEKARIEMAGQGFGAWLNENASRQVPVNGEMVSLKQANAEQRAAVVAYLASEYMQPFQGYNKSFLGKYLFPGMQKGQASTMAALSAERQKLIKANQLDEAGVTFRSNVTAEGAQQYRNTLLAQGFSNAEIRQKMLENANTVAEVEAIGAIEFGGNGKTFAENYGKDYNEALNGAISRQDDGVTRELTLRKQADQKAKLDYMRAEEQDLEDGSFDADPAMLAEKAAEARMNGYPETAQYIESRIAETAGAKTSAAIRKGYELQMMSGVIPSKEEILMNSALTVEDKQALIGKATENAGQAEPSSARAKSNKREIHADLESRANWTKDKAADSSIEGMKFKAWQEYTTIYNDAIESGKSPDAAAKEAMADFRSKFGDDAGKGFYAVGIDPNNPKGLGAYINYDRTEAASTTTSPFSQFTSATRDMTPEQTAEYFKTRPEIFKGETQMLTNLAAAAEDTGQIGAIPPLYYELQQKSAGKQDILEMVETRLKANKLPPLPKGVTAVVSEVKGVFDEESYKYITYKPNSTRTDIGIVSSGGDLIYAQSTPAQEEIKSIFSARESPQAGYDAINAGKGGDRPGGATRHLGKPLTQMTLGEVKRYQNLPIGDPKGIFAVGKYQFIPTTLAQAAIDAGITDDMVFNEAVQDRIFFVHLDKYGAYQPWEQWWIQQGGSHLALTPEEKRKIEAFRDAYDPSKPWRQPRNVRPELIQ